MSEASDSPAQKITIAALITLVALLAVTSYFLYSSAASAQAKLESERDIYKRAEDAHQKSRNTADLALQHYDLLRLRVGTKAQEFDPAMAEITASFAKLDERLDNLTSAVNAALQTAQKNGVQVAAFEDLKVKVQTAIASFRGQPSKTFISSLDRLTEVMENLTLLTTQLSRDYEEARKSFEEAAGAGKGQKAQSRKTDNPRPATKD